MFKCHLQHPISLSETWLPSRLNMTLIAPSDLFPGSWHRGRRDNLHRHRPHRPSFLHKPCVSTSTYRRCPSFLSSLSLTSPFNLSTHCCHLVSRDLQSLLSTVPALIPQSTAISTPTSTFLRALTPPSSRTSQHRPPPFHASASTAASRREQPLSFITYQL